MFLMDHLIVVELSSYNKRCTRYFCEFHFNINENYILPKLCILLLLKFTKEDDKDTPRMNQRDGPRRISST
jgi:hypothetical protein